MYSSHSFNNPNNQTIIDCHCKYSQIKNSIKELMNLRNDCIIIFNSFFVVANNASRKNCLISCSNQIISHLFTFSSGYEANIWKFEWHWLQIYVCNITLKKRVGFGSRRNFIEDTKRFFWLFMKDMQSLKIFFGGL